MYISKIILENFQAFDKGEFVLSPNLNILVGVTNVGKSSVARALSLVLFNQWDKSWCRFGAKYCRVSILTDTGIEVIREKGEKVNRYILRLPSQPEQLFESFGTTVPEQVQQALRIHEVQVDTTDKLNLNLAGQMDALFLLSQTGSYRAKVLGKLSGATYLDHAIRELNKDKRQVTAEKNSKDLEIVELQAQVSKLESIESYSDVIKALEGRLESLRCSQERVERIRSLFERVKVLKAAWLRETEIEALLGQVEVGKIDQLVQKSVKLSTLSLLFSKFTEFHTVFEHQTKLQTLLSQIDLDSISQLEPKVNRVKKLVILSAKYNAWQGMYSKQNLINNLLTPVDISVISVLAEKASNLKRVNDLSVRISRNQKELVSKADELGQVEQQYQEAKEQYSEMLKANGTCPICGVSTI